MIKRAITVGLTTLFVGGCLFTSRKENLQYLKEMVEKKPMDPKLHYKLADLYCRLDSASQAIEEYKTLIKLEAKEADDYWLRVRIASFLGLEPFPIISLNTSGRSPSFSLDSRYIIYEAPTPKTFSVFIFDLQDTLIKRVTEDSLLNVQPYFMPDGEHIVFASLRKEGFGIYEIGIDGKGLKKLNPESLWATSPSVSPDSRWIAFEGWTKENNAREIWTYDLKKKEFRKLTNNIYTDGRPRFSLDSKRIVFHSNRDLNYEIYMMDIDGKNLKRLTHHLANDGNPSFSPDGKIVAFASDRKDDNFEIYFLNLQTSELIRITHNSEKDDKPAFSPDGHWLAFQKEKVLYLMDLTSPITRAALAKKLELTQ